MIVIYVFLFVAGLACLALLYQWFLDSNPRNLYHEIFHAKPSQAVRHLKASLKSGLDYEESLLQFQADAETVQSLAKRGYRQLRGVEKQRFQLAESPSHPPFWWKFTPKPEMQIWVPYRQKGKFLTAEAEFLAFDPATNWAYYHYLGVN